MIQRLSFSVDWVRKLVRKFPLQFKSVKLCFSLFATQNMTMMECKQYLISFAYKIQKEAGEITKPVKILAGTQT